MNKNKQNHSHTEQIISLFFLPCSVAVSVSFYSSHSESHSLFRKHLIKSILVLECNYSIRNDMPLLRNLNSVMLLPFACYNCCCCLFFSRAFFFSFFCALLCSVLVFHFIFGIPHFFLPLVSFAPYNLINVFMRFLVNACFGFMLHTRHTYRSISFSLSNRSSSLSVQC